MSASSVFEERGFHLPTSAVLETLWAAPQSTGGLAVSSGEIGNSFPELPISPEEIHISSLDLCISLREIGISLSELPISLEELCISCFRPSQGSLCHRCLLSFMKTISKKTPPEEPVSMKTSSQTSDWSFFCCPCRLPQTASGTPALQTVSEKRSSHRASLQRQSEKPILVEVV